MGKERLIDMRMEMGRKGRRREGVREIFREGRKEKTNELFSVEFI